MTTGPHPQLEVKTCGVLQKNGVSHLALIGSPGQEEMKRGPGQKYPRGTEQRRAGKEAETDDHQAGSEPRGHDVRAPGE